MRKNALRKEICFVLCIALQLNEWIGHANRIVRM